MSTNNHTPVATGAAANSGNVNAPLGQLDAAIGDLTDLDTTEKNSAVGAINELKSTKQDIPASQAANRVYASPDGSAGAPGFRALGLNDLPASGITPGTYSKVTVDTKGRVTAGGAVQASDIADLASVAVDTLGATTDNVNNDASITKHGFMPKLANDVAKVINGLGQWIKWACGIKYNGSGTYTARGNIDFRGAGVSVQDDPTNDAIRVTISGIAGGVQSFEGLSDVSVASPAQNQVPVYNASAQVWENQNISSFIPTGHVIQDETVNLTNRPSINFAGNGVEASDNSAQNRTDVTVTLPVKATGAEVTTGTDDAKFATAKALKDAGIVATPIKASSAEVTSGTDDAKFTTAKSLKDAGIVPGGGNLVNRLINGGFDFAQRQIPGTLTTILTDKYCADRFRISSQAAGLQYQRLSALGETGLSSSYFGRFKRTTNVAKDMIYQAIESINSVPYRGRPVIFQGKIRANADRAIRIAVVELQNAATEDVLPGTFVTTWGNNGVDPTLGSNLAVVVEAQSLSVTTSWQLFSISVTVPSNSKNLIPVIWTDQQTQINDYIDLAEYGLFAGSIVQAWDPPLVDKILLSCYRYFELFGGGGAGITTSTTVSENVFRFSGVKRKIPTIALFYSATEQMTMPGVGAFIVTSIGNNSPTLDSAFITLNSSGLTAGKLSISYGTNLWLSADCEL